MRERIRTQQLCVDSNGWLRACVRALGLNAVLPIAILILASGAAFGTEIVNVTWETEEQMVLVEFDRSVGLAAWGRWRMYVNAEEVPMEGAAGEVVARPAGDPSSTARIVVGTLPWPTGLSEVDFPCEGTLQFDIPGEGPTNIFSFSLAWAGCSTGAGRTGQPLPGGSNPSDTAPSTPSIAGTAGKETAIIIDGDPSDWSSYARAASDPAGDGRSSVDILGTRVFANDQYVYMLLEFAKGIGDYSFLAILFNPSEEVEAEFVANASPRERGYLDVHEVVGGRLIKLGDFGEIAEGTDALELRLPLDAVPGVLERVAVEVLSDDGLADAITVADIAHLDETEPEVILAEVEPRECTGNVLDHFSSAIDTLVGQANIDVCVTRDSLTGSDTYTIQVSNVDMLCPISSFAVDNTNLVPTAIESPQGWPGETELWYHSWNLGAGIGTGKTAEFILRTAEPSVPGLVAGHLWTFPLSLCGSNDFTFEILGPKEPEGGEFSVAEVGQKTLLACDYDSGEVLQPALLASPASTLQWERLGGPDGGLGYDIRMRADDPEIMYVTDAWSGIHRSGDGGETWYPSNDGISARTGPSGDAVPVFSLTIDPSNPLIIWAGTQNVKGLFKSTDGGTTWTSQLNGITERSGISFRGFSVDPSNSDVVYAAGEILSSEWAGEERTGIEFDMTKGVVYKTTDGGNSWRAIWRGDNLARYVWVDPRNTDVIYVSTGIFDREAANSDPASEDPGGVGILKSLDGGATWQVLDGRNGLHNLYVGSLFMHPQDPDTLLAGVGQGNYYQGGGIYLTNDGGETWRQVLDVGLEGDPPTSVEFSISDPSVAYAASSNAFYRSEDGGDTWDMLISGAGVMGHRWGPEGFLPGFPIDFQVDPRNSDRIFVNNYNGGNLLSEDGGLTWSTASSGYSGAQLHSIAVDTDNRDRVYTIGRSGPFCSCDGGRTWTPLSFAPAILQEWYCVALSPEETGVVLVSDEHTGLLMRSTDGGKNWGLSFRKTGFQPSIPTERRGFKTIVFSESDPDVVYAGMCQARNVVDQQNHGDGFGVYRSVDGGRSWTEANDPTSAGRNIHMLAVHPQDADVVYAGTAGGGVLKTTNGGQEWQSISSGLRSLDVRSVALDSQDPRNVYAGLESGGVYKSTDGGASWRESSRGMPPEAKIRSLIVSPINSRVLFAGDYLSGVYISTNAGETWKAANAGLVTRAVTALALSSDGGFLYAATEGEGVFRLDLSGELGAGHSSSAGGDRDGDGVPDAQDYCPDFPGNPGMNGC